MRRRLAQRWEIVLREERSVVLTELAGFGSERGSLKFNVRACGSRSWPQYVGTWLASQWWGLNSHPRMC